MEKHMTYHRFTVIVLCSAMFCDIFAYISAAEVVQAYRTPSEADLQWLRSNTTTLIPCVSETSEIVQTAYIPTRHVHTFVPNADPCRPVGLPEPSIPPAPTAIPNKMNTGLVPDEKEGVVNTISTVPNAATPVVQMSGERLSPPAEVPREPDMIAMLPDSTIERLPILDNRTHRLDIPPCADADTCSRNDSCSDPFGELSCGTFRNAHAPCTCLTCIVCGDHRKHKESGKNGCNASDDGDWNDLSHQMSRRDVTVFDVPSMIGSSAWFTGTRVGRTGAGGYTFASPTMLLSRPNVAEHFNASVQNRIWADCRQWNNAVSFNNERRAVDQYSFGLEKKIGRRNSIELRVPLLYQYGSAQNSGATATELGNTSVFAKHVWKQGTRWTLTGGVGASLPTAENWRPDTSVLKNDAYYLVTFLGAQWHPNSSTFGHIVVQSDMPIEKNELISGSARVKVEGQQVIRTGVQLGHWIYRADHGKRPCRFGAFAEVDYAVVTDRSVYRAVADAGDTVYVSADSRQSTLTAAVGMPMVFGKLTCTNALILPVTGNNHSFSAAYNFSLSRQF
jgi:hypothetical protein